MAKQCKAIFLLVSLVLISLASCQDKSTALVRSWKLEDMRLTKKVPDALKPTIQKSIDDIKKNMIEYEHKIGKLIKKIKKLQK